MHRSTSGLPRLDPAPRRIKEASTLLLLAIISTSATASMPENPGQLQACNAMSFSSNIRRFRPVKN
jgi:hypothetical protein